MTETPAYGSGSGRRRVLAGAVLLAVTFVLAAGAYTTVTASPEESAAAFGPNDTLNASVFDAAGDATTGPGEPLFAVRHQGGAPIGYQSLTLVVYHDVTPVLRVEPDRWQDVNIVLRENGTAVTKRQTFAPGDRLRLVERPSERVSFRSGTAYMVVLVNTESGRTIAADRVVLH